MSAMPPDGLRLAVLVAVQRVVHQHADEQRAGFDLKAAANAVRAKVLVDALVECRGNIAAVARRYGSCRRAVQFMMIRYGLREPTAAVGGVR